MDNSQQKLFINHFGTGGLTSIALQQRGWIQTTEVQRAQFISASVDRMKELYDQIPQKFNSDSCKISHFRNHGQLTRKDMLAYHIREAEKYCKRQQLDIDFSFLPKTYFLPMEFAMIPKNQLLIVKPACMARGAKIFVCNYQELKVWYQTKYTPTQMKKQQLDMDNEDSSEFIYIVQQYISLPLLIMNHKFDCRIYVLLKSVQPLDVWLCDLSFARVASQNYDNKIAKLSALTNVSVNKSHQPDMLKIPLHEISELFNIFEEEKFKQACCEAENVIIRCLQACCPFIIQEKSCFELVGFDILFDSNYKAYVMEANASPSLSVDGSDDRNLKLRMLHDLISILYLQDGSIKQFGCFRQIYYGKISRDIANWDKDRILWDRCLADKCDRVCNLLK